MYTKETFIKGIQFLQGLSKEEYYFYSNFFRLMGKKYELIIVTHAPWDGDPEEAIKPQDFKDFEKKQLEEGYEDFKNTIELYKEAYAGFL